MTQSRSRVWCETARGYTAIGEPFHSRSFLQRVNQICLVSFHALSLFGCQITLGRFTNMHAIEARGLVKQFDGFRAVDGIDLNVPVGSIYGILGPNGAGKTTTIRRANPNLWAIFRKSADCTSRCGLQIPSRSWAPCAECH